MKTLLMMLILLMTTTAVFAESSSSDKEKIRKLQAVIAKQAVQIAKLRAAVMDQSVPEGKTGKASPLERKKDRALLAYNDGLKIIAAHKKEISRGRFGMKGSSDYRRAVIENKKMEVDNYRKAFDGGAFADGRSGTPYSAGERLRIMQKELMEIKEKKSRKKKRRGRYRR